MASFIYKLRIQSLRAQIDRARRLSAKLAGRFESARTQAEKDRLVRRYDRALQRAHTRQHRLEVLERKVRESSPTSTQRLTSDQ